MKEIVVISGKGGTGKTSITASFAQLANDNVVVGDCDVDAADLHLLLEPKVRTSETFQSGYIAKINPDVCTNCGKCALICRFDAIETIDFRYSVNEINCEGCAYCEKICPAHAIDMEENEVGEWFSSHTKFNSPMVHARMNVGAENSGKLVAKVKSEAKRIAEEFSKDFIIIDGSPGVGCPVISSLSGANYVILVTEPSLSGIHDLKRVYELVKKFQLNAGCIINKYDLNMEAYQDIIEYLKLEEIDHLANIPYHENFTKAYYKWSNNYRI